MRRRLRLSLLGLALGLSGCGTQSPLDPHSGQAHDIADLWWWMLGAATIVFLGALTLLVLGWIRRDKPGLPLLGESERANTGLVLAFGMVVPAIVLVVLFGISDIYVIRNTEAPKPSSTAMTIEVTGHQWFWAVRYPGTRAVTANEIHIPARTRVNVVARSADVIHSFWVPALNRKVDMIPGHPNRLLLYADQPGVYRGQCSEFCGLQHAHMAFQVVAQPRPAFDAWLANMAKPTPPPATPEQRRGEQVFMDSACASCHTMRGTPARGDVGPDLTHLATRSTLAALTIPNQYRDLAGWVRDPQHVKPGNKMPSIKLSDPDFRALLDYLVSRR
jgi:cytochrome c oxidase subunit 2